MCVDLVTHRREVCIAVLLALFLSFIRALHIIACLFLLNDNNVFMYSGNLGRAEQMPAN